MLLCPSGPYSHAWSRACALLAGAGLATAEASLDRLIP